MTGTKYRIVPDTYLGYEAQYKRWYWPFWRQIPYFPCDCGLGGHKGVNTNVSERQAQEVIEWDKNGRTTQTV